MSWIRKSPFADGKDPTAHMLTLIAAEADRAGTPLSAAEKQMLLAHWDPKNIVPEDFRTKAKKPIEQTFNYETDPDNPHSLGNSVEWAGDGAYPTIVALTEEVILERSEKFPRLRGRRKIIAPPACRLRRCRRNPHDVGRSTSQLAIRTQVMSKTIWYAGTGSESSVAYRSPSRPAGLPNKG